MPTRKQKKQQKRARQQLATPAPSRGDGDGDTSEAASQAEVNSALNGRELSPEVGESSKHKKARRMREHDPTRIDNGEADAADHFVAEKKSTADYASQSDHEDTNEQERHHELENAESDDDGQGSSSDVTMDEAIEHKFELSDHVKEVIWRETSHGNQAVQDFFIHKQPTPETVQATEEFFRQLNDKIHDANQGNGTPPQEGQIGWTGITQTVILWRLNRDKLVEQGSQEDLVREFTKTYGVINLLNERHYLPEGWNISPSELEDVLEPRDIESLSNIIAKHPYERSPPRYRSPKNATRDTSRPGPRLTGFEELEARAQKEQRALTSGTVLYWWKKGSGYQTFVQYGTPLNPLYRIRAGSYEPFNRKRVEQVLSTHTRGVQQRTFRGRDGILVQEWTWTRAHVDNIIGIGWKVPDDDESAYNPLSLIVPEQGGSYPETRAIVKWKDGKITLETRTFIRRITTGSNLDGDSLIYQKASELEQPHRKTQIVDEVEAGFTEDSSYDDENELKEHTHRSSRNSGSRHSEVRFEESSDDSDTSLLQSEPEERIYRSPRSLNLRQSQPRERNPTSRHERPSRYAKSDSFGSRRAETVPLHSRREYRKRQARSTGAEDLRRDIENLTRQLSQMESESRPLRKRGSARSR